MHPYRFSLDADALVLMPGFAAAYLIARTRFPAPRWRVASFMAGCALMLAVQIGPLDTLALHYLLSIHLLQNVVIAEWGPLLCVLGLTPRMAAELERIPGARLVTHPLVALPAWLVAYGAWHLPWAYDAALHHQWTVLHAEHATYFAAGCLVWWPVVHGRHSNGTKAVYTFGAFGRGAGSQGLENGHAHRLDGRHRHIHIRGHHPAIKVVGGEPAEEPDPLAMSQPASLFAERRRCRAVPEDA